MARWEHDTGNRLENFASSPKGRLALMKRLVRSLTVVFGLLAAGLCPPTAEGAVQERSSMERTSFPIQLGNVGLEASNEKESLVFSPEIPCYYNLQMNEYVLVSDDKMEMAEKQTILGIAKEILTDPSRRGYALPLIQDVTARLVSFFPLGISIERVREIIAEQKLKNIISDKLPNHFISATPIDMKNLYDITLVLDFDFTEQNSELKLERFMARLHALAL